MNITFLIGNGFDLNIGLRTQYTDFFPRYVNLETKDKLLREFRHNINSEAKLWSSAEMAFGQYTKNFAYGKGEVENFVACHEDFCTHLAKYLEEQESRIDYDNLQDKLATGFVRGIQNITSGFRTEQRDIIQKSMNSVGGGYQYNFISFNYTRVLDQCVKSTKSKEGILGIRSYSNHNFTNTIENLLHVHGYTDRDMVLGVNDESQIGNMKLFENQYPEYLAQIVKRKTNQMNEENMDTRVQKLLENSDLIYIYGMSIGETDAIWWERLCELLKKKANLRVILHCFDAPQAGLFRTRYIGYEREMREKLVAFSKFDEQTNGKIMQQIHIDTSNIFNEIESICDEEKAEQKLKAI